MVTSVSVSTWHLLELGIPHSCALNSQTEMGRCYPRYPVVVGTGDGKKWCWCWVSWVESISAWKYHHFCHPAFLCESHTHTHTVYWSTCFWRIRNCSAVRFCVHFSWGVCRTYSSPTPWVWAMAEVRLTGCLPACLTDCLPDCRKRGFRRKNFSCVNPAVRRCSKIHLHEKEFEKTKKFTYKKRISRSQSLPWIVFASCNSSFILLLYLSLSFP